MAPGGGRGLRQRVQELVEQQRGPVVAGRLHLHPDQAGALVAQRAGRTVGAVAELADGGQDPLAGVGRDPVGAVQRVGDRLGRDAHVPGDVARGSRGRGRRGRARCRRRGGRSDIGLHLSSGLAEADGCLALKSARDGSYPARSGPVNPPLAAAAARPGLARGRARAWCWPGRRPGPPRRGQRLVRRRRPAARPARGRGRGVGPRAGAGRRHRHAARTSSPTSPGVWATDPRPHRAHRPGPGARPPTAVDRDVVELGGQDRSTSCSGSTCAATWLRWPSSRGARRRRPPPGAAGRACAGSGGTERRGRRRPRARGRASDGRLTWRVRWRGGSRDVRAPRHGVMPRPSRRGARRRGPPPGSRPPTCGAAHVPARASPTSRACCCATATTPSWRPAARGSSPSSAGTRSGPHGCWSRFDTGLALSTLRVLARRQGRGTTRRPRSSRARSCTRCARALDLGDAGPAAGLLRQRRCHPAVRLHPGRRHAWGADPDQVAALLPAARRLPGVAARAVRRSGWLRYVDQTGHGLVQPGLEGQPRLRPVRRRSAGRAADRPVRGAGLRLRGGGPRRRAARRLSASRRSPAWWRGPRTCGRASRSSGSTTQEGGHLAIALDREGSRSTR